MTIKIINMDVVQRRLKELPEKMQRNIARKTARRAARPLLAEIKSSAPVETGKLRDSFKIRALRRSRRNRGIGVRVITEEKLFGGETFYGSFVELGTKYIEAVRFMRDAKDRTKGQVADILRTELKRFVDEQHKP